MSSFKRRVPTLVFGLVVAALLVSCADRGTTPSIVAPTGPALGYAPPYPCDLDPNTANATCTGVSTADTVAWEQLVVCKVYKEGTGPDVEIKLHADYVKNPEAQGTLQGQTGTYTLKSGECKTLWRNGESKPEADIITVSETPVPGYTTTSQLTTVIRHEAEPGDNRHFDKFVNAATSATSVTTTIGGTRIPGALVVFTNTKVPPPPPPPSQPSCTLTQGYWKNHEEKWPAPYSPTAQWLDATHKVNGVTWDGLMGMSVAGGNAYMQLAHQWIAATLNLNGATSNIPAVAAAMTQAKVFLLANTPASTNTVPNFKNAQATAWASTLDNFNNGMLGIPHCN